MTKPKPPERAPTRRNDAELWSAYKAGVTPLKERGVRRAPAPSADNAPTASADNAPDSMSDPAPARAHTRPGASPAPPPAKSEAHLPPLAAGAGTGLDARTMMRLRRGQIRPSARLDLHGMTQARAHSALRAFIAESRTAGRRAVIVITGKGRLSEGGGVLRTSLPGWLNGPELRPHILAFAEARPADGGAGAFYVLLRRAGAAKAHGP